jgi:hypothetical protein
MKKNFLNAESAENAERRKNKLIIYEVASLKETALSIALYSYLRVLSALRVGKFPRASRVQTLSVLIISDLAALPLVKEFRENRRAVELPGDNETRFLPVAFMPDVTQDQDPTLLQVPVQFPARAYFGS